MDSSGHILALFAGNLLQNMVWQLFWTFCEHSIVHSSVWETLNSTNWATKRKSIFLSWFYECINKIKLSEKSKSSLTESGPTPPLWLSPSYLLYSLRVPTGWVLWITGCSSGGRHSKSLARFCSYTGKFISIFISMNIFCWGWKITLPNRFGMRGCEQEMIRKGNCAQREKNHCVTPGEKYCCFA